MQNTKSMGHFARHVFLISKIHSQKQKAEDEVKSHLAKMRKSIIRMSLSYKDIDRLKDKINILIDWERKYSKFFRPEDSEIKDLKGKIISLEEELQKEKEEKYRIMSENNERIKGMSDSLEAVKHRMRILHIDKAKRQRTLNMLDNKINKKIDRDEYYNS
ncbi:MAG TPA: hypothetical protein VJJ52_05355 [Candidatus Nanoarchaeia archaeon]|nr:hypothetical protein [Candidatus Nanoarchaeia archaeon]